jgi:hypothetical protein
LRLQLRGAPLLVFGEQQQVMNPSTTFLLESIVVGEGLTTTLLFQLDKTEGKL